MKTYIFLIASALTSITGYAGCPAGGAPTTYGANNVWIGYAFDGTSFNTYKGQVNEGTSSSPNFDESFGGSDVNYNTIDGCAVETETFSMRYKLAQNFVNADYTVVVGADDGYRLSIDGGATWIIDKWSLQSYTSTTQTIHLSGMVNLVLEYYENTGDNRISFNITKNCTPSGNPLTYGSNSQWIGYIYSGMNFDTYKGYVFEGTPSITPNFDESFGGDNVSYGTSDCPITTTQFSVRYRLTATLTNGIYKIVVGADDGYRLSLDGGNTYVINKWNDQGYASTTYTATLGGTYNMVLDYYENGGANRVSFNISGGSVLPVTLTGFEGQFNKDVVELSWKTMMEKDIDHYEMERSTDGFSFNEIGSVPSQMTITTTDYQLLYHFTDQNPLPGTAYYRIKVVGKDNYINLSPIVFVTNSQVQGTKIYPTLIQSNTVFVETEKTLRNARLEFFDLTGKKLSETSWESLNGRQSCPVSRSSRLPSGTYLARLTAGGQTIKNQLMIVQNN